MFYNINNKIQKNIIFLIIILLLALMVLQYYKIKNKEGFTNGNEAAAADTDTTNYPIFTDYCMKNPSDYYCKSVCAGMSKKNPNTMGYATCKNFCIANPTNADCVNECNENPTNTDCIRVYNTTKTFKPTMDSTSLNCNTLC